jgi:mRNA-degrading endonuclease RelE of RelBE toxin-antitoxin system
MRLVFSARFDRSLRNAPAAVKKAFRKQSELLLANPRHPSLQVKKYGGFDDVWQARVTRDWRFYFTIRGDSYFLIDITAHPK